MSDNGPGEPSTWTKMSNDSKLNLERIHSISGTFNRYPNDVLTLAEAGVSLNVEPSKIKLTASAYAIAEAMDIPLTSSTNLNISGPNISAEAGVGLGPVALFGLEFMSASVAQKVPTPIRDLKIGVKAFLGFGIGFSLTAYEIEIRGGAGYGAVVTINWE